MNLSIRRRDAIVLGVWMVNKLKAKITILIDAVLFGKYKWNTLELNNSNDTSNDFKIIVERHSCWCILFIDNELKIEAKIIHRGRGKYKILEDRCRGRYVNKIVDASDVIRCKV